MISSLKGMGVSKFVLLVVAVLLASHAPCRAGDTEAEALAQAVAAVRSRGFATAVGIYRALDQRGVASGTRWLGVMHWMGAGVAQDFLQACDYLTKAERAGDAKATVMLAECFHVGPGLRARRRPAQKTEAQVGCAALNRMTRLGMPTSQHVA